MKTAEEILMRNLSRERTDADRRKANDLDNFKLWKRVYPDTYKQVLRAMDEYAKQLLEEYTNRISPELSIKSISKNSTFVENSPTLIIEKNDKLKANLHISVDKESIKSQLSKFLKELE